jgi:hypothetical protein
MTMYRTFCRASAMGFRAAALLGLCAVALPGRYPPGKAKVGKECRAKEFARYSKFMTWWNRLYWDNDKNGWGAKPEYGGKMLGPGQPLNLAAAPVVAEGRLFVRDESKVLVYDPRAQAGLADTPQDKPAEEGIEEGGDR